MKNTKNTKDKELIITTPKIDKISAVVDISGKSYGKIIKQSMWDELKDTNSGFVNTFFKGAYSTSAKIFCPDENGEIDMKEHHLLVQISTKYKPHMRIEYNPSKINDKMYEHLQISFLNITGQTFFEILSHCRVTRLDVCCDALDVTPEDYMVKVKYSRHSQCVFGKDGTLETIYFGRAKNTQYTIYKKSAQEYPDAEGPNVMRIECRLRKSMSIHQLPLIDNPFERIELYNLKPIKMPNIHVGHFKAFTDSVRFRGSPTAALKLQPNDVRNKLKYCLKNNAAPEWKPKNLWGSHWLKTLDECRLLKLPKAMPFTLKTATGDDEDEIPCPDKKS